MAGFECKTQTSSCHSSWLSLFGHPRSAGWQELSDLPHVLRRSTIWCQRRAPKRQSWELEVCCFWLRFLPTTLNHTASLGICANFFFYRIFSEAREALELGSSNLQKVSSSSIWVAWHIMAPSLGWQWNLADFPLKSKVMSCIADNCPGTLCLDVDSGPKWQIDCNICHFLNGQVSLDALALLWKELEFPCPTRFATTLYLWG